MSETLADGTELPKPLNREVHRHGFYKSSLGKHIEYTVVEVEHPTFTMLSLSCNDERFRWAANEYLAGIVAVRIGQGMKLMSLSESGATLQKAA